MPARALVAQIKSKLEKRKTVTPSDSQSPIQPLPSLPESAIPESAIPDSTIPETYPDVPQSAFEPSVPPTWARVRSRTISMQFLRRGSSSNSSHTTAVPLSSLKAEAPGMVKRITQKRKDSGVSVGVDYWGDDDGDEGWSPRGDGKKDDGWGYW